MPQITIELEGVAQVTKVFNKGISIPYVFENDQIMLNITGSLSIYVLGPGASCFSTVKDINNDVIRVRKKYTFNDKGGTIIRYLNL